MNKPLSTVPPLETILFGLKEYIESIDVELESIVLDLNPTVPQTTIKALAEQVSQENPNIIFEYLPEHHKEVWTKEGQTRKHTQPSLRMDFSSEPIPYTFLLKSDFEKVEINGGRSSLLIQLMSTIHHFSDIVSLVKPEVYHDELEGFNFVFLRSTQGQTRYFSFRGPYLNGKNLVLQTSFNDEQLWNTPLEGLEELFYQEFAHIEADYYRYCWDNYGVSFLWWPQYLGEESMKTYVSRLDHCCQVLGFSVHDEIGFLIIDKKGEQKKKITIIDFLDSSNDEYGFYYDNYFVFAPNLDEPGLGQKIVKLGSQVKEHFQVVLRSDLGRPLLPYKAEAYFYPEDFDLEDTV